MSDSLLLVLPLPAYRIADQIYLDDQACYGLDLWLDNFSSVTVACPTYTQDQPPPATKALATIRSYDRLQFQALPVAYTPLSFVTKLPSVSSLLSKLIDQNRHLHFAIGGFWGDWGAVASIVASRKKRPYAVWTDRVESAVMAFQSSTMSGLRRPYHALNAKLATLLERFVIKRSAVGLFNGMDCFRAYSDFCQNPQLVANYNFPPGSHISDTELQSRLSQLGKRPVKLVYVGRAHKDKGVFDWIDAIAQADGNLSATWYGDGPELEAAREKVALMSLQNEIEFAGAISHHETLERMKQFDAFVFCHKTQESPRCLVEALVSGLPIVGYKSDYAAQLIAEYSGGILSPINDISALAASIETLAKDADRLSNLSKSAARDGERYDPVIAFRHRSELIKIMDT